jgi:hypothetical protein
MEGWVCVGQSSNFPVFQNLVVGKLQVMVEESKAELWDSITYFATTTQNYKGVKKRERIALTPLPQ